MKDPLEEQLRSTFRQVAQQTTTTHDLGMPSPSPRPSRSRRVIATAALSLLAVVGAGALVVTRDDGTQTVSVAGDDGATAPETTVPSIGAALANACSATPPPGVMQALIDKVCAGGGLTAVNPFAACGIEAGAFGDLLAPVMTDLGPLLDRLKAVVAEFEPRIRAITDDPATKAKIEAALPQLRERFEALADPASRPDLSDPAARQKLLDDLKAAFAPLTDDTALKAEFEAVANDLRTRLEALAETPDAQAFRAKIEALGANTTLRSQAEALLEKLQNCQPR